MARSIFAEEDTEHKKGQCTQIAADDGEASKKSGTGDAIALQYERIKHIGIKPKFVVNGFIREIELELLSIHGNDAFYTIPELVTFTCLLFYVATETFDKISSQHILTGLDNNTITKNGKEHNWDNAAYGKDWIDSMSDDIYVFSIKMNCVTKGGGDTGVGFVTNNHHQETETDFDAVGSVWIRNDLAVLIHEQKTYSPDLDMSKRIGCGKGDTMNLVLNMKLGQIECYKNDKESDKDIVWSFKKLEGIKYRFALGFYCNQSSVTVTTKKI